MARALVPDDLIDWATEYPAYDPPYYDSPVLEGKVWADPKLDAAFRPKFNDIDNNVDRRSHVGQYQVMDGYPLNPYGRTGLRGRGVLGRFGPNHAADPIVSRWKRLANGLPAIHEETQRKILQMCIIRRQDCGEYALPGGMVDPGECVSQTLKREFTEEALNGDDTGAIGRTLDEFFAPANGTVVYKNYVDDPRNTDNAWMETVAVNFHDDAGTQVGRFRLCAGDDAAHVQWLDIDGGQLFYASHRLFIEIVAWNLDAHW